MLTNLVCTISRLTAVLPSPQRQNMPNCVSDSEYAKEDKHMPNFFVTKKQLENRQ